MSVIGKIDGAILTTIITGNLGDNELVPYYEEEIKIYTQRPWYELIDGTHITGMTITRDDLDSLRKFVSRHQEIVFGGRVAMVATSSLVFGMFRMWEIIRNDLDYEVCVFREFEAAKKWLETTIRLRQAS